MQHQIAYAMHTAAMLCDNEVTGAGRSPHQHATTHDQARPHTSTSMPLSDDAQPDQSDDDEWADVGRWIYIERTTLRRIYEVTE